MTCDHEWYFYPVNNVWVCQHCLKVRDTFWRSPWTWLNFAFAAAIILYNCGLIP